MKSNCQQVIKKGITKGVYLRRDAIFTDRDSVGDGGGQTGRWKIQEKRKWGSETLFKYLVVILAPVGGYAFRVIFCGGKSD